MFRHHLIWKELDHLSVRHLLITMRVNDLEQRLNILLSIALVLHHDIHSKNELFKFLLIDNPIMILVNFFEKDIKFLQESLMLL